MTVGSLRVHFVWCLGLDWITHVIQGMLDEEMIKICSNLERKKMDIRQESFSIPIPPPQTQNDRIRRDKKNS